jgi:hypothetical protein
VRTLLAESLRFPEEGQSAQGQSVPKARPKGVVDGQQVNIPVPPKHRYYDGVTQKDSPATDWKWWFKRVGGDDRQIRCPITLRRDVEAFGLKVGDSKLPRKTSKEKFGRPYRKPTQVDGERIPRRMSDPLRRNSAK